MPFYYCEDAVSAVATYLAPTVGGDAQDIVEQIRQSVLERLADDEIEKQMAARRSWRRVSADIVRQTPSWQDIAANDEAKFTIELDSPKHSELERYRELLQASDFDSLASRYPILQVKRPRRYPPLAWAPRQRCLSKYVAPPSEHRRQPCRQTPEPNGNLGS